MDTQQGGIHAAACAGAPERVFTSFSIIFCRIVVEFNGVLQSVQACDAQARERRGGDGGITGIGRSLYHGGIGGNVNRIAVADDEMIRAPVRRDHPCLAASAGGYEVGSGIEGEVLDTGGGAALESPADVHIQGLDIVFLELGNIGDIGLGSHSVNPGLEQQLIAGSSRRFHFHLTGTGDGGEDKCH